MAVTVRTRESKKGKVYWLDICSDGSRTKRTLKIDFNLPEKKRKELAQIKAAEYARDLQTDSVGVIDNKSRNFIELFETYVAVLQIKGVRKYVNTLAHLKRCFGSQLNTRHLTTDTMETWKKYLLDKFTDDTAVSYWRCTKRVINVCKQQGMIAHNPTAEVKPPKASTTLSKSVLSVEELQMLSETPMTHPEVCKAFFLCCYTGMCRADLLLLRWHDIDLPNKRLTYTRAKTRYNNRQTVPIDLTDETIALLPEKREGMPLVYFGLPSDSYCARMLKQWAKNAGLEKRISFYVARHTYAILLLEKGADLLTVSKLLGHSTTQHTERYLRHIDKLKKQAIHSLPKLRLI